MKFIPLGLQCSVPAGIQRLVIWVKTHMTSSLRDVK